jgi:hypothetical protein
VRLAIPSTRLTCDGAEGWLSTRKENAGPQTPLICPDVDTEVRGEARAGIAASTNHVATPALLDLSEPIIDCIGDLPRSSREF